MSEVQKPLPKVSPKKYRGMGDVVHAVAQPIAKMIDHVAGTSIKSCSACGQRREALNRIVPFGSPKSRPPQPALGSSIPEKTSNLP